VKHDVIIHSSDDQYSSFPGLQRSSDTILVSYTNQQLDRLRASDVHPHYAPVALPSYGLSEDGGRTWSISGTPPGIGPVEHATRGGHGVSHAFGGGGVVSLMRGYVPGTTTPTALTGNIYSGSSPVGQPFEISDFGPFETFYPFDTETLGDGSLLLAGYHAGYIDGDGTSEWEATGVNPNTVLFLRGTPDGREWSYCSHVRNTDPFCLTESSLVDAGGGRVVCVMRTDWVGVPDEKLPMEAGGNGANRDGYGYFMYQSESLDYGVTWSEPVQLPIWGHPPYCLKLRSGSVLMVYGHRRPPFEIRAILSTDGCRTWDTSTLTTLHRFDPSGIDIGYPLCTQLPNGEVFCTFYGYSTNDVGGKSPHAIYGTLFTEDLLASG